MSTISNPSQFRTNIANALYTHFFRPDEPCSNDELEHTRNIATSVENSIYQFAVQAGITNKVPTVWTNTSFVMLYQCRFRSIFHNLKHEPQFVKSILDGTISEKRLETIQHVEIAIHKWEPYIQQLLDREKYAQEQTFETSSDLFVCPKCDSARTTHYSLQTRGGDEPMTIFISCLGCDHKWTE